MLIAIPSKNRAGNTTTNKILPNVGTFFVPKSEEHQYRSYIKNVVAVPNDVRGITATRNWILQNAGDERLVFLDDDVRYAGYTKMTPYKALKIEIKDEVFWHNEFAKFFDMCDQLDYKIWGLKTESAPRSVYPYKPFNFKSYVTASCMGIVNDGEYLFDEEYKVKEDYEVCLRHIRDKGGILAVRYLHWENEHWTTDGGCKDYRTVQMEKDAIKLLARSYPGMVRRALSKANKFTIELNL